MLKTIIFSYLLSSLAFAQETTNIVRVSPERIGLVLVSETHDGFAIATDGAQFNADGTSSEVQKLFQVGKYGAIAFAGNVSIQDPVDRPVREEVNVSRIAKSWLDSHPDANLVTANAEINALISQTLTKFFSTRKPGARAGKYIFSLVSIGFIEGKELLTSTEYFVPLSKGKAPRADKGWVHLKRGGIWPKGSQRVLEELVSGNLPALKEFKAEPAVKKRHSSPAQSQSAQDLIDFFDVILRASESDEGKKLDRTAPIVTPPNRLAIVSEKDGFTWKK
ncbi:MAG TPA: hypothetical protein VG759_23760 [Candidatus Angelobacter sp.]|jgi:hypothetical protein|nr:hypothetical protein [Candidatus Angelobacter sp.]